LWWLQREPFEVFSKLLLGCVSPTAQRNDLRRQLGATPTTCPSSFIGRLAWPSLSGRFNCVDQNDMPASAGLSLLGPLLQEPPQLRELTLLLGDSLLELLDTRRVRGCCSSLVLLIAGGSRLTPSTREHLLNRDVQSASEPGKRLVLWVR
jgi:hypothetical protein